MQAASSADKPIQTFTASAPVFTPAEEQRLAELRKQGGLRVATILWPGIIEEIGSGTYSGFHYKVLSEVSRKIDVPIQIEFEEFDNFFAVNGTVLGEGSTVEDSPDIFERIDLIAYDLTILPWRERIMRFVPMLPVRMMVITRKGESIVQLGDLDGKSAAIFANSSHETYLRHINRILPIKMDLVTYPYGTDILGELLSGNADFCIRDSNNILKSIGDYPGLEVSMALGHSFTNAWAVSKTDHELQSILNKMLDDLRNEGFFDRAFRDDYGISIDSFFSIINFLPGRTLSLTDEEQSYLEDKRRTGGLRVAIDSEQSVYEIGQDGRPMGLHYNLVLAAADLLSVPVSIEPVNFREFFMKNGQVDDRLKTDPSFTYRPDLLERVDIYAATMSPLPWREKFLRFIPLFPSRLVYMIRKDAPRPNPSGRNIMRFTILKDTSYEGWIRDHYDAGRVEIIYAATGLDQARLVAEGTADVTLSDANLAITRFYEFPDLTFFPADGEYELLSWAVDREDAILAGILSKATEYLKADSTFETLWLEYYGSPFSDYLMLLEEK